MERPKIDEVHVEAIIDDYPDLSWIGNYTDDLEPGVIVRSEEEFYEKLPCEMERDVDGKFIGKGEPEIPPVGRHYRGFKPYAGGEPIGTKNYYKYGMEDFKMIKRLEQGDFAFIGIIAKAVVSYPIVDSSRRSETLTSGGLWGIASDDQVTCQETTREQLEDLKTHLERFNVDLSNWEDLAKDIELENNY